MPKTYWTFALIASLKNLYPDRKNSRVSMLLGCSEAAVKNKAQELGLRKSAQFWEGKKSGRYVRKHAAHRPAHNVMNSYLMGVRL